MSRAYANAQPSAQTGMVVAPGGGGNRNSKNMPVDSDGRDWSNGVCGCIWLSIRLMCYMLPLRNPDHGGSCCSGSCFTHGIFAVCGLGFLFQMTNRKHVRGRYNIKGSGCNDCCTSFWCSPCQLTQESREIELEEQSFGTQRY